MVIRVLNLSHGIYIHVVVSHFPTFSHVIEGFFFGVLVLVFVKTFMTCFIMISHKSKFQTRFGGLLMNAMCDPIAKPQKTKL